MIFPSSTTNILSQSITVDNLWATINIVYSPCKLAMAFCISLCVSLSSALVASSNKIIYVSVNRALAIASRCF